MTNSFHQIPLSEASSNLLSVQTPWGLVRPKFLPEGVGPASDILQSIVKEIFNFEDFPEWTIVIFDNFLVLAHDFEDAARKLERVIARCSEFGVILKIKKSFIGYDKVTFFGYEVKKGSPRKPIRSFTDQAQSQLAWPLRSHCSGNERRHHQAHRPTHRACLPRRAPETIFRNARTSHRNRTPRSTPIHDRVHQLLHRKSVRANFHDFQHLI